MFIADDLGAWLIGLVADAGRKRLADAVLGSSQERELRLVAKAAIRRTAEELCPHSGDQADALAAVISQVFSKPVGSLQASTQHTLLDTLRAGVAEQLALLRAAW